MINKAIPSRSCTRHQARPRCSTNGYVAIGPLKNGTPCSQFIDIGRFDVRGPKTAQFRTQIIGNNEQDVHFALLNGLFFKPDQ